MKVTAKTPPMTLCYGDWGTDDDRFVACEDGLKLLFDMKGAECIRLCFSRRKPRDASRCVPLWFKLSEWGDLSWSFKEKAPRHGFSWLYLYSSLEAFLLATVLYRMKAKDICRLWVWVEDVD
jgi:hypothetical protein